MARPQAHKTTALNFQTEQKIMSVNMEKFTVSSASLTMIRRRNGEKGKNYEPKPDNASLIQYLYHQPDNGKAFQFSLEKVGNILVKGDKRGFVLVDEQCNITTAFHASLNGNAPKTSNNDLMILKIYLTSKMCRLSGRRLIRGKILRK